ncbi:MAG: acyl-CoA dehydrogenase family protein [Paracoccaceae bacterium]
MNFGLSPEQEMMLESAQKFVQRSYTFENRRRWADSDLAYSQENWQMFAGLGWLGIPFSEANGGFGGDAVDVMVIQEVFGQALVAEPFVPNVILCGGLIERLGTAAQKDQYLTRLIAGEVQFGFAHTEDGAGCSLSYVGCQAEPDGPDFILSGKKIMVLNGHEADTYLVSARTSGDLREATGIEIFLVDTDTPGVNVIGFQTIDGLRAANVEFDHVRLSPERRLGDANRNFEAIATVNDQAILAVGAEAVGIMKFLYETSLNFVKERKQFGVPIGSFQVLQHRIVDMLIAYEECRSLLFMATLTAQEGGAAAKRSASALKVKVAEAGIQIAEQAIQLHGAMGTTDELDVGYYYKRMLMIEQLYGNSNYHLDRFCRLEE